jgi:uncharacterized protein YigE (DUF2233 family)
MSYTRKFLLLISPVVVAGLVAFAVDFREPQDDNIISFRVDSKKHDLKLYWKDDSSRVFRSIQNLKLWLDDKNRKLLFAMNAGMYKKDSSPQGLFIEQA